MKAPLYLVVLLVAPTIGFFSPVSSQDISLAGAPSGASPLILLGSATTPTSISKGLTSGLLNQIDATQDTLSIPNKYDVPYKFFGQVHVNVGETDRYCSGQFVSDDIFLTAAHCVQSAAGQYYKLSSVQLNSNGKQLKILGSPNQCVIVPADWALTSDPYMRVRSDFAFIKTEPSNLGGYLNLVTSSQPRNRSKEFVTLLGFPFDEKQPDGSVSLYQLRTKSRTATTKKFDVLHPKLYETPTLHSEFNDGVSGGGWLDDTTGDLYSINSSYADVSLTDINGYPQHYIVMYGPFFPVSARDLVNQAERCN